MPGTNPSAPGNKRVVGRSRVVGLVLVYVSGLFVAVGIGFLLFVYLMMPMMGAGAGPSDPTEPTRFFRTVLIFSASIIGGGFVLGGLGLYLVRNPVRIRLHE